MSRYNRDAAWLSEKIAEWPQQIMSERQPFVICSGGGPGTMEAANRVSVNVGGKSIALGISLPFENSNAC